MSTQPAKHPNEYLDGRFVVDVLPQMIVGRTSLRTVFVSCHYVGHYMGGVVDTGKKGLHIFVMRDTQVDQCSVSNLGNSDLLVVYLDINGFDKAIQRISEIKKSHQAMKVVAVACNCGIEEKRIKIAPLMESKAVDAFVITNGCGGYRPMLDILEGLIEFWPSN